MMLPGEVFEEKSRSAGGIARLKCAALLKCGNSVLRNELCAKSVLRNENGEAQTKILSTHKTQTMERICPLLFFFFRKKINKELPQLGITVSTEG